MTNKSKGVLEHDFSAVCLYTREIVDIVRIIFRKWELFLENENLFLENENYF